MQQYLTPRSPSVPIKDPNLFKDLGELIPHTTPASTSRALGRVWATRFKVTSSCHSGIDDVFVLACSRRHLSPPHDVTHRLRVKNRPSRPRTVGTRLQTRTMYGQELFLRPTCFPQPMAAPHIPVLCARAILVPCVIRSESAASDLQLKAWELFHRLYKWYSYTNTSTLFVLSRIYEHCCHGHHPLVEVMTALVVANCIS